jgi:hypothetical protein
MIESAVRNLLLSYPAVTVLVSTRVYPDILPQDPAYPAITYQEISGPRDYTLDGPDGVVTHRVQLDFWGATAASAAAVRDAVEGSISGVHHIDTGSPAIRIHGVFIDNSRGSFESALDASDSSPYRRGFDIAITVSTA